MPRTKKVKASGRFKIGYGTKVRTRLVEIEAKQRKKQICPFCNRKTVIRIAAGIWKCKKCRKKFASKSYFLEE